MTEFEKCIENHEKMISEALGNVDNVSVYYSAYASDYNGLPINNLSNIAIKGKAVIYGPYNPFWGKGQLFHSEVLENPTWLDLCVVAEKMIKTTGNYTHIFFENVKETTRHMEGVTIYEFCMGS